MKNNTAMIYTRGNNKEWQVTICEEYAKNNGLEVIGTVSEDTFEAYGELGNIDILLVSHLSRIARTAEEYIEVSKSLSEDGIKIISAR